MNRHLLTFLVALFMLTPFTNAQSYQKKYGFEINGGLREYHGDLGSALYLQQAPNYQAAGIAFGMYINPSFDANIYGASGDLGYYKQTYDEVAAATYRQGFKSHITELNLGVTFKLANGNIISEDAMFRPFVRAGLGGIQAISTLSHNKVGYSNSRTWYSSNVNGGVGVKIALSNALDLVISEQYNYSFDDNYDGSPFTLAGAILNDAAEGNKPLHDIYAYHNIGIVFNFGDNGGSGYKIKDSDGDGVSDKFDVCPKTPEGYRVDDDGCPLDDDKDGVINEEDKCPNLAGLPEFGGCPELRADLIERFNLAAKGIYFETAQDVIKTESYTTLDTLVMILNENPNLRVVVEGHTDNQGDAAANLNLSQKRANAVKRYLVEKGIATARLTPVGYGETKPVADNGTADGRALNRRVNFVISYY
jgi:outer membrane protein OmpA-like peptidoglycan-associated protein